MVSMGHAHVEQGYLALLAAAFLRRAGSGNEQEVALLLREGDHRGGPCSKTKSPGSTAVLHCSGKGVASVLDLS